MSEQFSVSPSTPPAPQSDKKGLAIASLILGIVGFCGSILPICGGLFGLGGIVLGVLGLKSSGKGMAIAGIILGALGILLAIVFFIIGLVSGPIIEQVYYQITTPIP
ncbi:MAG: DUF4190 domain-containing protein [Anaerolineales bacterium]|nr:DUF4190 domain-containing protein [Anaerolineales bacterium]